MLKQILILLLINAQIVSAVYINQVLYNPIEESGSEAIELYNPEDEEINISGGYIKTESYEKDAVLPEGTILKPGEYYLIADKGWSEKRDKKEWRIADYEESITIKNENSGISLYNVQNELIDAVCWGGDKANQSFCKGEPAQEATQGNTLLRIKSTGNNKEDFKEAEAFFPIKQSTRIILLQELINLKFILDNREIQQNEKILPLPGKNRILEIKSNQTINAEFLEENYTIEKEGEIEIPYYLSPGNYSIKIKDNQTEQTFDFEYLELRSYKTDTAKIIMEVIVGSQKEKEIMFINQGNVPISLEFRLENLEDIASLDKENIKINPEDKQKLTLIINPKKYNQEVMHGAIIIFDS